MKVRLDEVSLGLGYYLIIKTYKRTFFIISVLPDNVDKS